MWRLLMETLAYMPTYEYRCHACGAHFEAWQKITDDPIRVCPSCGAQEVNRVLFPVGLVFKGSGFYKTDNRDAASAAVVAGATPEAKSEAKAETASAGAGETKSEAKPASGGEGVSTTKGDSKPVNAGTGGE